MAAPVTSVCVRYYQDSRERLLNENSFQVKRDIVDYFVRFGPRFQKMVKDLQESDLWVDLGAGHAYAHKDWILFHTQSINKSKHQWFNEWHLRISYLRTWWPLFKPNPDKLPKLVSLSFKKPKDYVELPHTRFRHDELDITRSSLEIALDGNPAKILTDYFGNLSYTEMFSQDLKKYLKSLASDGSLFVSLDNSKTMVSTSKGQINIIDWLESQPGIQVRRIWTKEIIDDRPDLESQGLFWDGDSIEIKVTNLDAFLDSPGLRIKDYKSDGRGEPTRLFVASERGDLK